jgi:hypothetical protein
MKKFSLKKLLLTILCSIVITTFIGTTYLFITSLAFVENAKFLDYVDTGSEVFKQSMGHYEKIFNETVNNLKLEYGEDYPAAGVFFNSLVSSGYEHLEKIYIISVIIGILVGSAFYIIVIQNAKGKKLIIELLIALGIILSIIYILNIGYEAFIYKATNGYNTNRIIYTTELYDIDNTNTILIYVVVVAIAYIGNLVYQKIQTNRLNKELNKSI